MVREGDTLSSIAANWLADPTAWRAIQRANPGIEPEGLRPGDRLVLPAKAGVVATPNADRFYIVREGDTLMSIARQAYDDARLWRHIHEANRTAIVDPDRLAVGRRLRLPPAPPL